LEITGREERYGTKIYPVAIAPVTVEKGEKENEGGGKRRGFY